MTGLRGTDAPCGARCTRGSDAHRRRSAHPIQLAARRGETPSVSVGADGTAVAAWVETGVGVRVAIATPGRAFGAARTVRPRRIRRQGRSTVPDRRGRRHARRPGCPRLAHRRNGAGRGRSGTRTLSTATAIGVARQHDPRSRSAPRNGGARVARTPRDPVPAVLPPVRRSFRPPCSEKDRPPSRLRRPLARFGTGLRRADRWWSWRRDRRVVGERGAPRITARRLGRLRCSVTAPGSTVDGANTLATDASGAKISMARTVTYAEATTSRPSRRPPSSPVSQRLGSRSARCSSSRRAFGSPNGRGSRPCPTAPSWPGRNGGGRARCASPFGVPSPSGGGGS